MHLWLPLALLAFQAEAPAEHEYTEHQYAETVYATGFEGKVDANYDGWPDDWTRRRGRGFPQYLKIGITDDSKPLPNSERCFRINLDGGGATIFSPPIEVSPLFSHQLEMSIKTESLKHDEAYFSITFLDAERVHKETYESARIVDSPTWQHLSIGPVIPTQRNIRYAIIGLHLTPTVRSDLYGAAMFDNLRLARLPRMSISTNRRYNIFRDPDNVEIKFTVSGTQQHDQQLRLELIGVGGQILATSELRMGEGMPGSSTGAGEITHLSFEKLLSEGGFSGSITWRPPVTEYGFYRIRVSLCRDGDCILQRIVSFAVARHHSNRTAGDFGWSLPNGEKPLNLDELVGLLEMTGVRWVKFPVWSNYSSGKETTRIAHFSDQLGSLGIEMIGMLDKPPEELRRVFGNKKHLTVAEVFLDPEVWHPAIDPMLIRLALKVRFWQLGLDDDDSFIGLRDLEQKVREIRDHLKQYGQRTRLGMAWQWMSEVPVAQTPPWDCLSMSVSPSFTSSELGLYIKNQKEQTEHGPHCWVTLKPLPKTDFDIQTRTRDLVLRMLAAKVQQAKTIFLGDPFAPQSDVMNADGTPASLFLPWCTTVDMISGTEYLGQIVLPNNSQNYIFARENDAIMVVWGDKPTTETLFLGKEVRHVDLWGEEVPLQHNGESETSAQTITVDQMPTFITGLDLAVTRWRLGLKFESKALKSVFGSAQVAMYRVKNTFPQGVGGQVAIQAPSDWDVQADSSFIKMGIDEEITRELNVLFHTDATSGPQRLRFDFNLSADHQYRFSVYRDLQVGLGDFTVELNTWLDDNGRLIVEQTLINKTERRLNFNCLLFVPGRRRLRQQLLDLQPGRSVNAFVLDDGQELLGKNLWLRAEEIGGKRLLNLDIIAAP